MAEPLPLYPINRNIADVIAADQIPERVKVINLQRSIDAFVDDNIERAPYLASISEEVEKVVEQLRQKQISAKTALEELEAKVSEMMQRGEEREESDLDDLAFALSTSLRAAGPLSNLDADEVDQLADDVAGYLQEHVGWPHNERLKAQVRLELYKRLLPQMQKPVNPQVGQRHRGRAAAHAQDYAVDDGHHRPATAAQEHGLPPHAQGCHGAHSGAHGPGRRRGATFHRRGPGTPARAGSRMSSRLRCPSCSSWWPTGATSWTSP